MPFPSSPHKGGGEGGVALALAGRAPDLLAAVVSLVHLPSEDAVLLCLETSSACAVLLVNTS